MSVVHLVSQASALGSCLKHVAADDAVLLLGDGVLAAPDARLAALKAAVAAIDDDAASRGVKLKSPVRSVGYAEFVNLIVEHDASVTWT